MRPPPDDRDRSCRIDGGQHAGSAARDFVAARSLKRQLLAELRTSWDGRQSVSVDAAADRRPATTNSDVHTSSLPSREDSRCRPPKRWLALPAVGDEIFGFRLCYELGRGSYARVFLAEQRKLAARPVVVKVSAIDGDEPQTLAQLQHTNIVPIYSVDEDGQAGLRVVCMPYFGGASLGSVLRAVWAESQLPTDGNQLVAALSAVRGPSSVAEQAEQTAARGPLSMLAGLSYIHAAVWIVARLAEALQHAHQRGVLHRDIKPSNILLSADGQPMLLDFNLAENVRSEHALAMATVGGTVAYMAPEHLRALAGRDPVLARAVDQRADLYGLGMVLYELLTGRSPFGQNASYSPLPTLVEAMAAERTQFVPSLRRHRPDVPWSLESITRKCLDPDPGRRYQQADHLAEDLQRYLEDRPLKYAPELSWRERIAKWRRRHPRLTANSLLAAVLTLGLAAGSAVLFQAFAQLKTAQEHADKGARAVAQQTKAAFLLDAQEARCFLNATLGDYAPVHRGLALCKRALGRYHILEQNDWQQDVVWTRLETKEQEEVAEDIGELLLLLARGQVLTAPGKADPGLIATLTTVLVPVGQAALPVHCLASAQVTAAALEDGLVLLDRASALGAPHRSRAAWEERATYLELLGRPADAQAAQQQARAKPPITARDHYLLGASYARNGRYAEAIHELKEALRLHPGDYWARFHLGLCYRQQGDHFQAAAQFRTCTALWPEFSWAYFNLGEVLHHLGKKGEALEAYSAALAPERRPEVVPAYFNRGLVYLDLSAWQKALADFDTALRHGWTEAAVHGGRGIALAQLGRDSDAEAAFAKAQASGRNNLEMLLSYAFAISQRRPKRAHEVFLSVLERDPENPRALYGCGMLCEHQRPDSDAAVGWFTRALKRQPAFVEARLARAIVLARQGRWDKARDDIDLCVSLEPTGRTLYGAACFYALVSAANTDPLAASWADVALQLLGEAFKVGYGLHQAANDPDLAGIRRDPKFRRLLEQAKQTNHSF